MKGKLRLLGEPPASPADRRGGTSDPGQISWRRRRKTLSAALRAHRHAAGRRQRTPAWIMSLTGKVALVTGGAQGIGRAAVQALLESSAKVRSAPVFESLCSVLSA
ncbi:hypothetical protein ILYODFUR_037411 [Ilyodon furcidens]|uniref:Uncharacterized protein n=1 Tax=Ilyodon furcidens TaxID=33524 RepID=A0ABV0UYF7_9TELE